MPPPNPAHPVIPSGAQRSRGIPWSYREAQMTTQNYYIYILTNDDRHTVLYIGVTNDLERRQGQHSLGEGSAFAKQYNAHKLICVEVFSDPLSAIEREKQLKNWTRAKKGALIAKTNPEWRDLLLEMDSVLGSGASR